MANVKILSWDRIREYLKLIGMVSDIDIQLVKYIYDQARVICPEELRTIFVSNYIQTEGKEQFKDLWLFSDNYVIETLNFNKQETPTIEITILRKNILSVIVETNNFALSEKAKDDSKLHIQFYTIYQFSCDQIAYGSNCDTLMNIYEKYIKHNLASGESSGLSILM